MRQTSWGGMVQNANIHARRDAVSDFSSFLLGLATARQTLRLSAPQPSCFQSKGGEVDPLPDALTCCQMDGGSVL